MVATCQGRRDRSWAMYPHAFNKQSHCNIIISLPAPLPGRFVSCLLFSPSKYNPGAPGHHQTGLSDYTQGLTRINKQSSRSKPAPPRGYPHECIGDCGKLCLDPEGVPFPEGKGTLTHHDGTNLRKTLLGSKINKGYLKCLQASSFLLKMSQPPFHGP